MSNPQNNNWKPSKPKPVKNNSPLLFTDEEMNRLMLEISDPDGKAAKLLNKVTHKYIKLFYTLTEASNFLNINLNQLRALRKQGELIDKKFEGKTCIYAGDLRRFLKRAAARQSK